LRRVPYIARKAASLGVSSLSRRSRTASTREKTARLARYLDAKNAAAVYRAQMAQRHDAHELVLGNDATLNEPAPDTGFPRCDIYSTMMYMDTSDYLPDDILVKVDRASMSVGLEARVPMLDHHVVEFAWQLPLRMKVRGGRGKWLLKQILGKYVPDSLPERPKMGFGVPVGDWVKGPLRDWAESLLSEERLQRGNFLNPKRAREQWTRHLAGDPSGGDRVWHMLAFQAWLVSVS
jgi:asparagine synthase (glutamine-hydrolysing)